MKIIKVSCCARCPYCRNKTIGVRRHAVRYCVLIKTYIKGDIPEECPLEEIKR